LFFYIPVPPASIFLSIMALSPKHEDSPLSPYLLRYTDSNQISLNHSLEAETDLQLRTLLAAADVGEGAGTMEQRLKRALRQVKAFKDLIVGKLLPELEALRRESRSVEERDRSADIVRSVDHLERRFYQSESILKRTIEDLKQQLESERICKVQLQQELQRVLTVDQTALLTHMQSQLQDLQQASQADIAVQLQAQELRLKEQHAREMAQMYENYDFERQKGAGRTATGEVKRLGEALGQIQAQNRFLLQLSEDKNQLISTLTAMLDTERSKSQPHAQVANDIQQIRSLVSDLLLTKEGNSTLEKRNATLSTKLAVTNIQKTERKVRDTERFYSAEIGQLSRMLGGLKTEHE
jgi:hypothetical protein